MPGILKYTPAWLSRPSPGFDVFASKAPSKLLITESKQKNEKPFGPQRTIARRGTEVFVAVGNELRWTDMVLLKERWDEKQDKQNGHGRDDNEDDENEQEDEMGNDNDKQDKETRSNIYHRVLKVPISRPIRQLIMSPREDYLAIVTSNTVHVAVLPDSSHLSLEDTAPLNLKTYHIGPTTHVLERAPIASAIWQPLASSGECLVTVTVDAIVRLWELDKDNRWSFDSPALAVDLRKLVNGHSSAEDFSPSKYGANKGFSPDSFEMEVASACFGGSAVEGEDPWAAMTLWIAMREGDVYALCPLLPSKWVARPSMIIELSETIACSTTSDSSSGYSQRTRNQLKTWASDLASQESTFEEENSYPDRLVMQRPLRPNAIPRLQGPFMISPEIDDMFDVTDIYAIPAINNDEADPSEDGEIADELEPSAASLLCLATADGKVHVLTGAGAVEGRWLPTRTSTQPSKDDQDEEVELLLIESVSVGEAVDDVYPAFTADPQVHHAVFVTHGLGVSYLDLSSWSSKLADEYNSTDEAGVAFRIDMLLDTAATTVEQPITFPTSSSSPSAISACIAISDSDLGFFALCTADDQPLAATLSEPLSHFATSLRLTGPDPTLLAEYVPTSDTDLDLDSGLPDSRPAYQPPQAIWQSSSLPTFLDTHAHPRARRAMSDELRLSPAVLQLMVEAHRVTSTETHRLGFAVSELFRRCERLQEEFREQIRRVRECRDRIDAVLDEGADEYTNARGEEVEADGDASEVLERRMARARERQEALSKRYAEVRRKVGRANGRPISEKEDQWITEIRVMERMVGNGSGQDDGEDAENAQPSAPKMPGGASVRAPRTEGDSSTHGGDTPPSDDDHPSDDDSAAPSSDLPHARFRQVCDLQRQLTAQVEEMQQNASNTGYEDDLSASMRSSTLQPSTSRAGGERRRAAQAEIELLLERQTALLEATSGQIARLAGLGVA